jgi:hypothetical protein
VRSGLRNFLYIKLADTLDKHKYRSQWLQDLTEDIMGNIDMEDVTKFDLMKTIGEQMALYIEQQGNNFTEAPATNGRDLLELHLEIRSAFKSNLVQQPGWMILRRS